MGPIENTDHQNDLENELNAIRKQIEEQNIVNTEKKEEN